MMKMLKKKDDGKKPMAKASKPVVKTPAPKAKATAKPKPLSNEGKYGLGAVARTVKGQGEMKQMMARPKTGTAAAPKVKVKPTREQKARAAGMVAAQRSRREGAAMSSMDRAVERGVQRTVNYLGQEFSDKANRYNRLSDSQLSDKKRK
jgi:hypothetical protein